MERDAPLWLSCFIVVVVVVVVGMRVPTEGDDGSNECDVRRRRQTTVVRWHRCGVVRSFGGPGSSLGCFVLSLLCLLLLSGSGAPTGAATATATTTTATTTNKQMRQQRQTVFGVPGSSLGRFVLSDVVVDFLFVVVVGSVGVGDR